VTYPDIVFAISIISQFLDFPCQDHYRDSWKRPHCEHKGNTQTIGYSNIDWVGSPSDRHSTSGYCVLVGVI